MGNQPIDQPEPDSPRGDRIKGERNRSGGFTISRSDGDGVCHLRLSGELDLATAPDLREALDGQLDGKSVVVDTTDLSFIDSKGLRVLVEARERLGRGTFTLIPGRRTDRLLELAGVEELFDNV